MNAALKDVSVNARALYEARKDFISYAETSLKIINKEGQIVPLVMNRAQCYIHMRLEQQLEERGFIRAIILKGRQQGASTYIEARLYWRVSGEFGKRAFILTHRDDATENLFNMTKRFNDNCPRGLRPHTKLENAKELYFDRIDSRFSVATAGGKETGRGGTGQFFHGSEAGFWANASKHMAGIGQVIPMAEGTEVILESTGNGIGNFFHQTCLDAMAGKSDYIFIFTPWFWNDEYARTCPFDVEWDDDEIEYKATFALSDRQMFWRRMKIMDEFKGDTSLFDQEYPATPEMAFLAGTKDSFISPVLVARATFLRRLPGNDTAPIIIGVDPAEYGDDESSITVRQGRKIIHREDHNNEGNEQIAGRVGLLIDRFKPDAVNVDVTGVGTGVEAFLSSTHRETQINRIHFGGKAIESNKYRDRSAEMHARMKDWLLDEPASLPDDDARLKSELTSRKYKYDASRRLVMESKEDMKKRGLKSPGRADSLALTFAVSIQPRKKTAEETLAEKLRRLNALHGRRSSSPGMTA